MNYRLTGDRQQPRRITDIVLHEQTGLLWPQRDPQALADALLRIAEDPAARARLARPDTSTPRSIFSWPAITDRLGGVLRCRRRRSRKMN